MIKAVSKDHFGRHLGSAAAMSGAGFIAGGAVGSAVGGTESVLPAIVNKLQGEEDSNYVDYATRVAQAGAATGTLGAAFGYMTPTDMNMGEATMKAFNKDFDYESATPAGKRRAGAVFGATAGAVAGSAGAALSNLIHAFNNATPAELSQMNV